MGSSMFTITHNVALVSFLLTLLCSSFAYAEKRSYIVYMGEHQHGGTEEDFARATRSHHDFLASFLGSHEEARNAIFYSYDKHINGFAARLDDDIVDEIKKHPSVISVFRDKAKKLLTTHSWSFMDLENTHSVPEKRWMESKFGKDTILATLDTGLWPEANSFSDENYGPVPHRWRGKCVNAPTVNQTYAVQCNRKLVGSNTFYQGFLQDGGYLPDYQKTARDFEGHGTHTLSTAAGNYVKNVKVYNTSVGIVKGGSPKARIAAYKICWSTGCYDSDTMKGFDSAIYDGVDVLSVSVGGDPVDYFIDPIAIGSFHAVRRGITVICAGGNSGPIPETVSNGAPWITTVAASTTDRRFVNYLKLGNGRQLQGESLSPDLREVKHYPLIKGHDAKLHHADDFDATLCAPDTLNATKVKGKILVCLRGGGVDRLLRSFIARDLGAAGMVLCNADTNVNDLYPTPYVIPTTHIDFAAGQKLFSYLNSTSNPTGAITNPSSKLGVKPAPAVADFSSRGPNYITPEILKPDITAPGVEIIAAWTEGSPPGPLGQVPYDLRYTSYYMIDGTSMATPHVSGLAGLLKTLYPHWSPAMIRSAIMTTARTRDNTGHRIIDLDTMQKTDPFSYGSGHMRPTRAMDPGLVYDLKPKDYLNFLCGQNYSQSQINLFDPNYKCPKSFNVFDLNYPSISIPQLNGTVILTRTLKNVGKPSTYVAHVRLPAGFSITVEPTTLKFGESEEKSFTVNVTSTTAGSGSLMGSFVFGVLTWTDGQHYVRSPIAVSTPYIL